MYQNWFEEEEEEMEEWAGLGGGGGKGDRNLVRNNYHYSLREL